MKCTATAHGCIEFNTLCEKVQTRLRALKKLKDEDKDAFFEGIKQVRLKRIRTKKGEPKPPPLPPAAAELSELQLLIQDIPTMAGKIRLFDFMGTVPFAEDCTRLMIETTQSLKVLADTKYNKPPPDKPELYATFAQSAHNRYNLQLLRVTYDMWRQAELTCPGNSITFAQARWERALMRGQCYNLDDNILDIHEQKEEENGNEEAKEPDDLGLQNKPSPYEQRAHQVKQHPHGFLQTRTRQVS